MGHAAPCAYPFACPRLASVPGPQLGSPTPDGPALRVDEIEEVVEPLMELGLGGLGLTD